ncbi:MAG: type II secretion system protein, partial [Planctomycetes bacterium]|nr:type II secretion system protein [Planctomycetota bacterium]
MDISKVSIGKTSENRGIRPPEADFQPKADNVPLQCKRERLPMGFRNEATHYLECRNSSGGFTLIEVIIVLAIIGLLAAVLTPTLARYVQNSRLRRATQDVKLIGAAIAAFYNDLGDWPIWQVGTARQSGDAKAALLYGPGTLPGQSGVPSGDTG